MDDTQTEKLAASLVANLRHHKSCVVAFSGGVDSGVVAMAAKLALEARAVAVTGIGPAVSERELTVAREVASAIGIKHVEVATDEIARAGYIANRGDRCYYCKTELYDHAVAYAGKHGYDVVANGTNCDDLGDYRPGLVAASEHRIVSPLVECGLHKADVRAIARLWDLSVADKPAAPCLASRLAVGVEVTTARLARVEAAEAWLYEQIGVADCRVRYHRDDLARIELPLADLSRVLEPATRQSLESHLRALGFRYVTIDVGGLSSGSLNPASSDGFLAAELLAKRS